MSREIIRGLAQDLPDETIGKINRYHLWQRSSSSSSACDRSVAYIGDNGHPTLSVVSSPDELIVGRFFFCVTKLFRLSVYFVRCRSLLFVPQIFPLNICFCSPSALFICSKNCSCLLLMGQSS